MRWRAVINQFVLYAGVGSIGTAAHYLLLLVLVELVDVPPWLGAVAGFMLGAVVNYYLNHRVTFRSARQHREALPRFLTVALVGVTLTGLLMAWATTSLHVHYFVTQIVTTGLLLCLTFVGNRLWTFRAPSGSAARQ